MVNCHSCSCLHNMFILNVRYIVMAKQLENIRQDIIGDSSYYSNIWVTIDFLIEAIDKNKLKDAKLLVNDLQNDVVKLAYNNKKVQRKLVNLIDKI